MAIRPAATPSSDPRLEAFFRVRRVSRWLTAGSVAAAAALVGVVATELPGRASTGTATGTTAGASGASGAVASGTGPTSTATSSAGTATSGAQRSSGQSTASSPASAPALAPPTTAPMVTRRTPVVVSGGTGW